MANYESNILKFFEDWFSSKEKEKASFSDERQANYQQLEFFHNQLKEKVDKLNNLIATSQKEIKNREYPKEINRLHNRIASLAGGSVGLTTFLLLALSLGGTTPSAWSPIFIAIATTSALSTSAGLAIPLKRAKRKYFDINNPKGREKKVLKNLYTRNMNRASVTKDMNISLDDIIKGKYKITEQTTRVESKINKGVVKNRQVTETKPLEQFKGLGNKTIKKILKIKDEITDDFRNLTKGSINMISDDINTFSFNLSAINKRIENSISKMRESMDSLLKSKLVKKKKAEQKRILLENLEKTLKEASDLNIERQELNKLVDKIHTQLNVNIEKSSNLNTAYLNFKNNGISLKENIDSLLLLKEELEQMNFARATTRKSTDSETKKQDSTEPEIIEAEIVDAEEVKEALSKGNYVEIDAEIIENKKNTNKR